MNSTALVLGVLFGLGSGLGLGAIAWLTGGWARVRRQLPWIVAFGVGAGLFEVLATGPGIGWIIAVIGALLFLGYGALVLTKSQAAMPPEERAEFAANMRRPAVRLVVIGMVIYGFVFGLLSGWAAPPG